MLEIVALIFLTRHLSKTAKLKGHTGAYAALGPVLWIGGEIMGAFMGTLLTGELLVGIVIGLVCAVVGAAISAAVVHNLPNKYLDDDFGDDYGPSSSSGDDMRKNMWAS